MPPPHKATHTHYHYSAFPRADAVMSPPRSLQTSRPADQSRPPKAAPQLILAERRLRDSMQDKPASRSSRRSSPHESSSTRQKQMDHHPLRASVKPEAPPSAWTAPALIDSCEESERQSKATGRRARGDSVDNCSASATSSYSNHSHTSSTPLLGNIFAVPPRKSSRRPSRVRREDVCDPIEVPTLHPQRRTDNVPVRRKPVPSQLRPRPSSPTLHHRDFMTLSPPRAAPSIPRGVTPVNPEFSRSKPHTTPSRRSAVIEHPTSFWDLDSEDESDSENEKVGLVGKVRNGFNRRQTSRELSGSRAIMEKSGPVAVMEGKESKRNSTRRTSRAKKADRSSWSGRFFCGC